MTNRSRARLQVGYNDLSIGQHSIGLPTCRTRDSVIDLYLLLLARLRDEGPTVRDVRSDDVSVLARTIGLEPAAVLVRIHARLGVSA